METTIATVLWRRLDAPGHDSCRLLRTGDGWVLDGQAVFRHEDRACAVRYRVDCDAGWRTREARVEGWCGADTFAAAIAASGEGAWRLDGAAQPAVAGCIDLDLGFTPATNLIALRRLAPEAGETVPARAAWLDFPAMALAPLDQDYRRLDAGRYAYRAPAFGYAATLSVDATGFVTGYPGLWEGEVHAAA